MLLQQGVELRKCQPALHVRQVTASVGAQQPKRFQDAERDGEPLSEQLPIVNQAVHDSGTAIPDQHG